ncbi:MAG: DNA repair protein RecO [Candidatus Poribacteria bacterium]|nr:DNA repair protein RecO [Candidatus Poribacteria bacterium]
MGVEKDLAIVIHSFPLAEADRIITFCTPQHGKVRAVAKNCRKVKSPYGASLELFNVGELVFFVKGNRSLQNVNSFDVSNAVGKRLRDPVSLAYASYLSELIGELLLENDPNPTLFGLLEAGLNAVAVAKTLRELQQIARSFELKALTFTGYRPHLVDCVVCGASLSGEQAAVGLQLGGTLCEEHAATDRSLVVDASTLEAARELRRTPFTDIALYELTAKERVELKALLSRFLAYRVERPLRCADYIDSLEKNLRDDDEIAH